MRRLRGLPNRGPRDRALSSRYTTKMAHHSTHLVATPDGWLIQLTQAHNEHLVRSRRPVVILPGYGMNAFIFGYHPAGTSMVACLCDAGFEVWTADLRGQGGSRRARESAPAPTLADYARIDLPAVLDALARRTHTEREEATVVGASLGGSIAYASVALRTSSRVGALVAVGSPLRWEGMHPALRVAFASPKLAGAVSFSGTRSIAEKLFPVLLNAPGLLTPYVNAENVPREAIPELVRTIEDPVPGVNRAIAEWVNAKDLRFDGVNVTEALAEARLPLLLVLANRDGIVPDRAALSARDAWGGAVDVLRVGSEQRWYAHADLFIGQHAPDDVFAPLASWLTVNDA